MLQRSYWADALFCSDWSKTKFVQHESFRVWMLDKGKLDPRCKKGIFLGYDKGSSAYLVYFIYWPITAAAVPKSLAHFRTGWAKIVIFTECCILKGTPLAFYTTCVFSKLGNALNRCHFNSSFIMFYCHHIHSATHRMPYGRTAYSLLQR